MAKYKVSEVRAAVQSVLQERFKNIALKELQLQKESIEEKISQLISEVTAGGVQKVNGGWQNPKADEKFKANFEKKGTHLLETLEDEDVLEIETPEDEISVETPELETAIEQLIMAIKKTIKTEISGDSDEIEISNDELETPEEDSEIEVGFPGDEEETEETPEEDEIKDLKEGKTTLNVQAGTKLFEEISRMKRLAKLL